MDACQKLMAILVNLLLFGHPILASPSPHSRPIHSLLSEQYMYKCRKASIGLRIVLYLLAIERH